MSNFALIPFCCCLLVLAVKCDNIPDQDYGYVEVRPNAHMFWWLYGCSERLAPALPSGVYALIVVLLGICFSVAEALRESWLPTLVVGVS